MKYIKSFEQQLSWAGSLLAFNNPEVRNQKNQEPIPLKMTYTYECLDCGSEYLFMKEDGDPKCPICKSKNSKSSNFDI